MLGFSAVPAAIASSPFDLGLTPSRLYAPALDLPRCRRSRAQLLYSIMPTEPTMIDVPAAQRPLFLGFDVGGTNIKLGVVDDLGRPLAHTKIVTEEERGPRDAVKRARVAADEMLASIGPESGRPGGGRAVRAGDDGYSARHVPAAAQSAALALFSDSRLRGGGVWPADGVCQRRQRGGLWRIRGSAAADSFTASSC